MNDSDYIKASERSKLHADVVDCGCKSCRVRRSHAAADDLMREQHEAIVNAAKAMQWILDKEPSTGAAIKAAMTSGSLERCAARYDRMTGGDA
jgi:hypothetical protein